LHNLEKDYITFQQNKKLYDQTVKEHGVQVLNSMTPYTDVINKSPEIKRISEEARQQMTEREKEYKDALDRAKKRRASAGG